MKEKKQPYITVKLGDDNQPEVEVGTENPVELGSLCAAAVAACALQYGEPAANFVLAVESTIIDLVSRMGG